MTNNKNATYGKRQEYKAIAKLLELGFDVYTTLVDDKGIDCIIRIDSQRYMDVQIKARSIDNCMLKYRGFFPQISIPNPRENYFFVLFSEQVDSYWVIPSLDIVSMASSGGYNISEMKSGKNIGKYSVRILSNKGIPLPQFERYKNERGFSFLKYYKLI
ncbi:hypothetical protein [Perlabentimonas gracilis]|uniref:hypothetical protein n=1 Tax=Perlabentimonas gracilis TaxID=2715279 RepID=UPI001408949E|nr:hypothetical protein [Perlabentimonas gracilis]NHB70424.1 hypothetical protein [Perlabentimonas gracilis]